MWAAGLGRLEVVRALLRRGADRSRRDDRRLSAADIARQAGHGAALGVLEAGRPGA